MVTLRLLPAGNAPAGQSGELLCCAYTPDGAFALSGGWDGHLRLWESAHGGHVAEFKASDKPIAACTVAPDGKGLVSGALDGMLTVWDAVTHLPRVSFVAHTRPISAIAFSVDEKTIATSAWDNTVTIWLSLRSRDARPLIGHKDIVAGCCFTPDGQKLFSWSHDATARLWDLTTGQPQFEMSGHTTRVLAGTVAPDGQWAATGARDGVVKLWSLQTGNEAASVQLGEEIQGCLFLRDGLGLVAVDKRGRMTLHSLPELKQLAEVITRQTVQSCALAPAGGQIALACNNGKVRFVAVDGFDQAPLLIGATKVSRRVASFVQRLFGRSRLTYIYQGTCPACRHVFELPNVTAQQEVVCASCRRRLRIFGVTRTITEK